MTNYYRRGSSSIGYYPSSTSTEPNMRQELINTLDGAWPEIAKGQPALLRRMRRDSNGTLISCPCVDHITKEPTKDRFCPICFSGGYYFDEENITIYRVIESPDQTNAVLDQMKEPGLIFSPIVVFYIKYNAEITLEDRIIELKLDTAGDVIEPLERRAVYRIGNLWDYRADNGKLEYWKIYARLEDVKYLMPPSFGGSV